MLLTGESIATNRGGPLLGAGTISPQLFSREQMLATGPVGTLIPSVGLTRALHLGVGQQRATLFGDELIPRLARDSAKVIVRESGTEHLRVFKTEVGFEEPYPSSTFQEDTQQFEMALFAFKYRISRDLVANFADAIFELTLGSATRADWAIRMDQENILALLFGTPTNYPVANRVSASGTEWDAAGGDSLLDLRIINAAILAGHPGYIEPDIRWYFTLDAWTAAKNDPTFATARGGITFADPSPADYESYAGMRPGGLTIADTNFADETGVVSSLWGELAIGVLDTGSTDVINPFGMNVFGLMHDMGVRNAYPPWFDENTRTDNFPMTTLSLAVGHDLSLGGIITDMKA